MRSVPARAAILGALFAAFVTLPGLGIGTLWDNSETAYGEVAREIVLTHDWTVMHLNGQPWYVQPPLYFWIAAAFAKLLGVTAFAMRLPSALATIAMGGVVGYATARIAGERAGIVASIVLSTSLMQAIVGRLAIMDALLDLAVATAALALYGAFGPTQTPRLRDAAIVAAALALALGTLAKGPVAPVITLLIALVWLLWERSAGRLQSPRPLAIALALCVYAAVTLPWFAVLAARVGTGPIVELLGHYTIGRYTGVIENQRGPLWYYIPVLILGFFPWIAFVPAAVVAALRVVGESRAAFARFALSWAIVPFVFFSFAGTKLPNYVALLLPALAILVALLFEGVARGRDRRAAMLSAATIPLLVGLVAFALIVFSNTNRLEVGLAAVVPYLVVLGVVMFAGSLFTVVALARRGYSGWAPFVLAATSGALVLFIAFVGEPAAEPFKPIPPLARAIDAQRAPGDLIGIHGVSGGNGLIFYTAPPVRDVGDNLDFLHAICAPGGTWIVARPDEAARFVMIARQLGRSAAITLAAPAVGKPHADLLHVSGAPCGSSTPRR
jgi:4-amino-4-deoxy-L-arabinose transferase-like glycosyltransferase